MMWWTNGSHLPPLVTTSPQGSTLTDTPAPGALDNPATQILFGDSTVYTDARAGVKITIGGWLDCCHRWGLEADWLTLGGKSVDYFASSTGNPNLFRPFFDVRSSTAAPFTFVPHQNSELVAFTDYTNPAAPVVISAGSVSVTGNDYFESVGMTLRYNLCCNSCGECCAETCDAGCGAECCNPCCLNYCRTDLLIGYRHYLLGDNLSIHEDLSAPQVNSTFLITDNFSSRNEFNGTEIGLNTELRRGRWSLGLLAKMAMGNNHETTIINGTTTINNGQTINNFPVGVFASNANSGVHTIDQFTVIPQFGVEMGYQLTCRLRAFLGYNVIYWAPVMRAGDQIDLNIDPRNFPPQDPTLGTPEPFPQYLARQTNFWAQGINVGTEFRF